MCANLLHLPVRATSCRLRNGSVSCSSHPTPLQHICDLIRRLLEWINGNLTLTCLANRLNAIKCLAYILRHTERSAPSETVLGMLSCGSAAENSPKALLRYHERCIPDTTQRWLPPPIISSTRIKWQMPSAEENSFPSIRIGHYISSPS